MERRVSLEGTCLFSSYVENVRTYGTTRPFVFLKTTGCFHGNASMFLSGRTFVLGALYRMSDKEKA